MGAVMSTDRSRCRAVVGKVTEPPHRVGPGRSTIFPGEGARPMDATKTSLAPRDACFETAYAGRLDISERDRVVLVYPKWRRIGGSTSCSDEDEGLVHGSPNENFLIKTIVSLSFQGKVVR